MPDETIISTSAPATETAEPSAREAIQAKYDTMYGTPPPETVVETSTTPEPVVVETSTAAPDANAALLAALGALTARMEGLETSLKPKEAPVTPVVQEDWLKLLSEGKKAEGEAALASMIRTSLGSDLEQSAVNKAVSLMKAEQDVRDFTNAIHNNPANADILVMEAYISAAANQRIQAAIAAGKASTPADYVTVYKEAVNLEIEAARKLALTLRGVGKTEALTRTTVVSSQPNLQPNSVNQNREQQTSKTLDPNVGESPQEYMLKRQAAHAKLSGMA